MLVTVRLFARLRELAGNAEIKVELPEALGVEHLPVERAFAR